jgi:hypothetical protein
VVGKSHQFLFLSFSSCLVSSSLSGVWQLEYVYCPQVPEISSVAHQPYWFWVRFLLWWFTGGLFFASPPFSGARSEIHQLTPFCHRVMMFWWLFFNFAVLFDFGCCSLAHDMSFVGCYMSYFRQWLIIHLLFTLLSFQSLFTESLHGDQLLLPLPFSSVLRVPRPLCCMFLFSFLFIVHFFFFCWGVSLPRGLCWFTLGVAVGILCDALCSPLSLPDVS